MLSGTLLHDAPHTYCFDYFFNLLSLFWGGHQHLPGENDHKANLFIHITYYLMTTPWSPFPQGWSSGRVEPSGLSPWCLSFFYLNLQRFYAYISLLFNVTFFLLVWFNLLTNDTQGWPEPLWQSEVDHVTQKLQTSPPYSEVSTVIILWGLLRHCGPRTLSHLPKVTHPANEGLLLSQICFLQISKFTELDYMVSGLNSWDYQLW